MVRISTFLLIAGCALSGLRVTAASELAAELTILRDWCAELGIPPSAENQAPRSSYGARPDSRQLASHLYYGQLQLRVLKVLAARATDAELQTYLSAKRERYLIRDPVRTKIVHISQEASVSALEPLLEALRASMVSDSADPVSGSITLPAGVRVSERRLFAQRFDRDDVQGHELEEYARVHWWRSISKPVLFSNGERAILIADRVPPHRLPPDDELQPRVRQDYARAVFRREFSARLSRQ